MAETLVQGLKGEIGKIIEGRHSVFPEPWDLRGNAPDPSLGVLRATQEYMDGCVLAILLRSDGYITVDPNEKSKGGHDNFHVGGTGNGGVALRQNIWIGPERTVVGVQYSKTGDLTRISLARKNEDATSAKERKLVDKRFSPNDLFDAPYRTQWEKRPVFGRLTAESNGGPDRDFCLREQVGLHASVRVLFHQLPVHASPQDIIAFVRGYWERILPQAIQVSTSDMGFVGFEIAAALADREAEKS